MNTNNLIPQHLATYSIALFSTTSRPAGGGEATTQTLPYVVADLVQLGFSLPDGATVSRNAETGAPVYEGLTDQQDLVAEAVNFYFLHNARVSIKNKTGAMPAQSLEEFMSTATRDNSALVERNQFIKLVSATLSSVAGAPEALALIKAGGAAWSEASAASLDNAVKLVGIALHPGIIAQLRQLPDFKEDAHVKSGERLKKQLEVAASQATGGGEDMDAVLARLAALS
jgi:hypothetical protein